MGFEIQFGAHPRRTADEGGGYDLGSTVEFVKRIGKSHEEIPLSQAAAVVLGQLARRDVHVTSVSISEFVKREVKYRESADGNGIVLRGQKFTFGDLAGGVTCAGEETPDPPRHVDAPQAESPRPGVLPRVDRPAAAFPTPRAQRPKRKPMPMVYMPLHPGVQLPGCSLTEGARYPCSYDNLTGEFGGGRYLLRDDDGKEVGVPEDHMVHPPQGLEGVGEGGGTGGSSLSFQNQGLLGSLGQMPTLR